MCSFLAVLAFYSALSCVSNVQATRQYLSRFISLWALLRACPLLGIDDHLGLVQEEVGAGPYNRGTRTEKRRFHFFAPFFGIFNSELQETCVAIDCIICSLIPSIWDLSDLYLASYALKQFSSSFLSLAMPSFLDLPS